MGGVYGLIRSFELSYLPQEVVFLNTMPADFLRSEQVVVVGSFHNETFLADKILMKCPSKYQEETIEVEAVSTSE